MNNIKGQFANYKYKYLTIPSNHQFGGNWHLLKANPLPEKNLEEIIYDIYYERPVHINYITRLEHDKECLLQKHQLPKEIKKVINWLKDIEYKVAIKEPISIDFSKSLFDLKGQPIVFVIEPNISFKTYPLHPHLNYFDFNKLPTSIYYIDDAEKLKDAEGHKILNTISHTIIWLICHQIWDKLDQPFHKESWIGPQRGEMLIPKFYKHYHPHAPCRCGSGKAYKDCHLNEYILKYELDRPKSIHDFHDWIKNKKEHMIKNWEKHMAYEEAFRTFFLDKFKEM